MKRLALFLILLFAASALPQSVEDLGVSWLFQRGNAWADSVKWENDSSYFYLKSTTGADQIESNEIYSARGGGDVAVHMVARNVSGVMNVTIQFGVYRGEGYPDYTGWEWNDIATFTSDGKASYSLIDATWNTSFPWSRGKIRIVESGAQQNNYIIWVHIYKQR